MLYLIELLNNSFSIFKQRYTYFHTLSQSHIFQKNTNNITQSNLPNAIVSDILTHYFYIPITKDNLKGWQKLSHTTQRVPPLYMAKILLNLTICVGCDRLTFMLGKRQTLM